MSINAVETRAYEVVDETTAFGRSTITITCPFCNYDVIAYRWSLAGSGKKCTCGAKFAYDGTSTKEIH